jgi:two-component system, NtrC family, sensor histidine kinase HydH
MTSTRGIGLRTQILLIFLAAAIVPLALVGLWLTRSAMRAGEDLLRSHLTESADRFAAAAASRWEFRRADLELLAGNDATVRAVTVSRVSTSDSTYLDALAADVGRTIPSIELRDAAGVVRWYSSPRTRGERSSPPNSSAGVQVSRSDGPVFRVEMPVTDASARRVGTISTDVALSALIPPDSARPLVPGARLAVRNSATGVVLLPLDARLPFVSSDRVSLNDEVWLAVERVTTTPPIEFVIAAPLTSYVAPFRRAATIGVTALLIVAGLAVLFAIGLASRVTQPLEQLAIASDAVTDGKLDQRVEAGGPAEVRRVGAAFNLMTENLRATLDALSRRSALAAVGEFATSLSHDVRNALTSIRVDLDRLSMRELNDPTAATLVTRALNSVARLEAAVTGALRVARRGQAPLKDVDLRAPIRAAADAVRGFMAALPAELELRLPSDPIRIRGDEPALQQLFANLLFNAAQAMRAGGVARVAAEFNENGVVIVIADDGVGISAAHLAKLETGFFSTKADGTGLGLPIARQIVAVHRGSLSIESREGRGTTVRIRLPLETNRSRDVKGSFPETTAVG